MKKLMIDLDETIVSGGYIEALNAYLGTNYKTGDIKEYYVSDILSPEENSKYLDYFYENVNIYDNCQIIPHALEVIEELKDYYDVYICTAFFDKRKPEECIIMARHKYNWILKNMPYINPRKILLTSAKELVMCEIKIDDKVSNLKRGYGETKLLLSQKHNEDYTEEELKDLGITRVNSWLEIRDILMESEGEK